MLAVSLFTYLKSGSLHLSIHPSIHPSHAPVMSDSLRPHELSLPFPHPGDLPDPGIKPTSTCVAGRFFTT